MDRQLLLGYMVNEEFSNIPVINMKTLLKGENMDHSPNIILLPGIEGMAPILEPLCNKLKAHVSCIQYCVDNKTKNITQLAESLIPVN